MINVTVSMDEDTARWVRVEAAKAGKSVSRWLGELLAERRTAGVDAPMTQAEALAAFLSTPLRDISDEHGRLPSREELYDEVLRRHERAGVREGSEEFVQTGEGEALARKPGG